MTRVRVASITGARVTAERIVFDLEDGREVSLPLSYSRRLSSASDEQRHRWEIVGGLSVHWPDIDEDIALWEALGVPEDVVLRDGAEAGTPPPT